MAEKLDSNKLISIILYSIIGLLGLFIVFVLYFPFVTMNLFGFAIYGGFSGVDASLDRGDALIVTLDDFETLDNTKLIVFELDGYGSADGLKVYKIMTEVVATEKTYRVHSSGSAISYQWDITEDMYLGTVKSKLPALGYIIGFLRSPIGVTVILINVILITTAVILVKKLKPQSK
ncbi:hypothetical protein JV173_02970 [Acholeplasma equirhinis]|uniref:hypothetical protein n=1 Tax=Acholeplasma equirhinis TaxID=555393 RepID=UPI00197AFDFE|nr:hypothetical protein [Acholeplasma equirhinis]MBN3490471.1 hypothetical protein [Acholeplasma equirhinis]